MSVLGWHMHVCFERRRVMCARCRGVRVERLDWLAQNPRYTRRLAMHVGRLCREMTNKGVAEALHLHEHTVKELDKQYMREQLARHPVACPRVIGIDEFSIRRGHTYRIIVSDVERGRVIWVGGEGRKEVDLDLFFADLGEKKVSRIEAAVMDMWPPFRRSLEKQVTGAKIIYDKFHVLRHLGRVMDEVRRQEYKRVSAKDRSFIKGQRYTLLSHWENLSREGRASLKKLLSANRRLQTAYLLKEEFGQLWGYRSATWARKFFERWKEQLKWQRLKPFVKFAQMVERHWEGIVSYCDPAHKVKLGFVEGVNNKVRVIQRRAYGYRDEEYLKLKILTAFLPKK